MRPTSSGYPDTLMRTAQRYTDRGDLKTGKKTSPYEVVDETRWDEFYTARSATTINENGNRWRYAVPRRVVQRSSALLVLKKPEDEFDPGRALAQRTVASS